MYRRCYGESAPRSVKQRGNSAALRRRAAPRGQRERSRSPAPARASGKVSTSPDRDRLACRGRPAAPLRRIWPSAIQRCAQRRASCARRSEPQQLVEPHRVSRAAQPGRRRRRRSARCAALPRLRLAVLARRAPVHSVGRRRAERAFGSRRACRGRKPASPSAARACPASAPSRWPAPDRAANGCARRPLRARHARRGTASARSTRTAWLPARR